MSRTNLLQFLSERVGLAADDSHAAGGLRVEYGPDGAPKLGDVIRLGWAASGARERRRIAQCILATTEAERGRSAPHPQVKGSTCVGTRGVRHAVMRWAMDGRPRCADALRIGRRLVVGKQ